MILTEKEAAEKWCPQARVFRAGEAGTGNAGVRCIGSACMMWEWVDQRPEPTQSVGTCGLINRSQS